MHTVHTRWHFLTINKQALPQCNKTPPNNNCISFCNRVLHISSLLAPLMITWHSCVPLYPTPQSLCLACLPIVLCGLERAPQFWLQQPHWVTKSTRRVSIFNLLSICCHSLRSAPSSRVGSAGCGTTRFGSRRNLPSWREISIAPRHSTAVRPPSITALLPFRYVKLFTLKCTDSSTLIYRLTQLNGNRVGRAKARHCCPVLKCAHMTAYRMMNICSHAWCIT